MDKEVLELFNVMVVQPGTKREFVTSYVDRGVVTDFRTTTEQARVLADFFKPLDMTTLFDVRERKEGSLDYLLERQVLHYIEVYGLDRPGLFNLERKGGKIVTMHFVHGVTVDELGEMVRDLLYQNAPVKDANALRNIIRHYDVDFDINRVANNELRVLLFEVRNHTFKSGDDVVRYMCYVATGEPMLIKSREVVQAIRAVTFDPFFLDRHLVPLAQVFNRHKRLILAAKRESNKQVINHISRLSKTVHVPVGTPISKVFVARALGDRTWHASGYLKRIGVRDKFKFLNLLAYKRQHVPADVFVIRNGKAYVKSDRPVYSVTDIQRVEQEVLRSLEADLAVLKGQNILLDPDVHYGLPVSRKQTMGQLPYGTKVSVEDEISSGMYWENDWGARDLDLSTINPSGHRVGWGQASGYNDSRIIFSGDIVDARNGAMEFMTSRDQSYGLFVNIFSGEVGAEMELVVGNKFFDSGVSKTAYGDRGNQKWIDQPIIREKITLNSRGNVIGFVRGTEFVVYTGRLSNSRISGQATNTSVVAHGLSDFWTVNRLFDAIWVPFDLDRDPDTDYVHDLSYSSFSYDKLERLMF